MNPVQRVCFGSSSRDLLIADCAGMIHWWQLTDDLKFDDPPAAVWRAHAAQPYDLRWSHDRQELLTADRSGQVRSWKLPNESSLQVVVHPVEKHREFGPIPRTEELIAATDLGLFRMEFATAKPRRILITPFPCGRVTVSPDGTFAAAFRFSKSLGKNRRLPGK